MPHDITSGRIYRQLVGTDIQGVNLTADIAPVLGTSSGDLGTLCTHADINKWARFKPIRFRIQNGQTWEPCYRPLTDEEFIGDQNAKSNQIYYGLERTYPQGVTPISSDTETWPAMHQITYEYLKPRGLDTYGEMYRALDFASWETLGRGYNHYAVPNPSGDIYGTVGYVNGSLEGIIAGYYDTNVEGVDLAAILNTEAGGNINDSLALTYPCILVRAQMSNGDYEDYFTALDYGSAEVSRPLYYQSALFRGPWQAFFTKTLAGTGNPPWTSSRLPRYAWMTLFMLKVPSASYVDNNGNPHLIPVASDTNGSKNFGKYWLDCASGGAGVAPTVPVPFPNAINKTLTLLVYWVGMKITASSASYTTTSGVGKTAVTFSFTKEVSSGGPYNYSADIIVDYDGQHNVTKTITGSSAGNVPNVTINASEFETVAFTPGREFEVTVRVSGTWGGAVNTKTTYFTVPS